MSAEPADGCLWGCSCGCGLLVFALCAGLAWRVFKWALGVEL